MIDVVLTGAIRAGTAVLFTSLGEVVAEKSGIVNLGAEGSMLVGALTAFVVTAETGNPYMGVIAGGLAGALFALIHAYLVINRAANQLASGLTILILAQGITAFFGRDYVARQITGLNPIHIPWLSDVPFIGPVFFQHDVLTYVAFAMAFVLWYFLARTKWGLILRATGEREEVVYSCGYSPTEIRYGAVVFGGFMAGLGGAQLSVAYTLNWVENMTQGRGLVAVALVIFAGWSPLRAILGSYLFGGAMALQLALQVQGVPVSPILLSMVPYLLTLAVLILVGQHRTFAMPEGLRAVFTGGGGAVQTNR